MAAETTTSSDTSAPLTRNPEFLKLWTGQTISVFGSLISRTALPFTAALALHATPAQVALLAAADLAPGLLVGLFAGAWADRVRRKPLMIAADIGRALLLAIIPLLAWRGLLTIEHLYLVGLLTGMLSMLFDVAYGAYLPTLVGPNKLAEGNAKLTATASAAEVGAFGISGWLVQWFGGPLAVGVDAVSFLLSAVSLATIRTPEKQPVPEAPHDDAPAPSLRREITEGLQAVRQEPVLRALALSNLLLDFSFRVAGTLIILFITRTLKVPTGYQGMIFAIGGVTSLLGALAVGPLSKRLGFGRTLLFGLFAAVLGLFFIPLAPGATVVGLTLLALNQIVTDPGYTIFEINQTSLRQAATPNHLRGRVEASFRLLGNAARLLGIGAAGFLGERIGLRETIFLGVAGAFSALLPLLLSPAVRNLRELPSVSEESAQREV
jgi:MFS family permease